MADAIVQVAPDSTGSKIDNESLTVGANTVLRQRINLADTTTAAGLARVVNATPGASDYGLVVRPIQAALPAGSNNIGDVDLASAIPAGSNQIGTVGLVAGVAAIGTVGINAALPTGGNNIGDVDVLTLPALPAGTNNIGDVDIASVPTLTKGTQGATGLTIQQLRDAGRSGVTITFNTAAPVVAETLVSAVKTTASVAAGGATSIGVTAGKTLRITNVLLSIRATAATTPWASLQVRSNPSGATIISSASLFRIEVGGSAAVIGNTGHISVPFTEGYEFSGSQTLGLTLANNVTTNIASIALIGYEY